MFFLNHNINIPESQITTVIGRGAVGKELTNRLIDKNYNVSIIHSKTEAIPLFNIVDNSDIIINCSTDKFYLPTKRGIAKLIYLDLCKSQIDKSHLQKENFINITRGEIGNYCIYSYSSI